MNCQSCARASVLGCGSRRRGATVAAVVVILSVVNVGVLLLAATAGEDESLRALRVESLRALYAAEAGLTQVVAGELMNEPAYERGQQIAAAGGVATVVERPEGGSGSVVVIGRAGAAERAVVASMN